MTGLRFLACEECAAVHARPMAFDTEMDARCSACGSGALIDIVDHLDDDPYFTATMRDGSGADV
ncbi:MAG: hypothetical protein PPP55_04810 [Halorubrum sp.]